MLSKFYNVGWFRFFEENSYKTTKGKLVCKKGQTAWNLTTAWSPRYILHSWVNLEDLLSQVEEIRFCMLLFLEKRLGQVLQMKVQKLAFLTSHLGLNENNWGKDHKKDLQEIASSRGDESEMANKSEWRRRLRSCASFIRVGAESSCH